MVRLKKSWHPYRKGGGSTLTVSLTVKIPFFYDSPYPMQKVLTTYSLRNSYLWRISRSSRSLSEFGGRCHCSTINLTENQNFTIAFSVNVSFCLAVYVSMSMYLFQYGLQPRHSSEFLCRSALHSAKKIWMNCVCLWHDMCITCMAVYMCMTW